MQQRYLYNNNAQIINTLQTLIANPALINSLNKQDFNLTRKLPVYNQLLFNFVLKIILLIVIVLISFKYEG